MMSVRLSQLFRLVLCVVLGVLSLGGCGGEPEPRSQGSARTPMKVVIVDFSGSAYAQSRSRALASLYENRPPGEITVEYVAADKLPGPVDSEGRAVDVARAQGAAVVVWSNDIEGASPQVQVTFVSAAGGARTLPIAVDPDPGATTASQDEPPATPEEGGDVNLEEAVQPLKGELLPPNLGPLPGGPGGVDGRKGQPWELFIGGEVHKWIAKFYRSQQPPDDSIFTNTDSIAAITDKLDIPLPQGVSAKQAGLMPDIYNATKGHLYEIKSSSPAEVTKGLNKLFIYEAALRAAGLRVSRGPASEPGTSGMVSAPGGYAFFTVVTPGLIIYRCSKSRPELTPLLLLGLKQEVLQNLGRATKKTPVAPPVLLPVPLPVPSAAPTPTTVLRPLPSTLWQWPEPVHGPQPVEDHLTQVKEKIAAVTGLSGTALIVYLIISEGSRVVFPPRNLLPAP